MATALSEIEEAGRVLADPAAYADELRLHAAMTLLRREQPVTKVITDDYRPFWAVTKHDDIMAVERDNALWINEPRPLLMNLEQEAELDKQAAMGIELKTLVHIDDPKHRVLRAIGADWFRPKAMRDMKLRTDELANRYVNKLLETAAAAISRRTSRCISPSTSSCRCSASPSRTSTECSNSPKSSSAVTTPNSSVVPPRRNS